MGTEGARDSEMDLSCGGRQEKEFDICEMYIARSHPVLLEKLILMKL